VTEHVGSEGTPTTADLGAAPSPGAAPTPLGLEVADLAGQPFPEYDAGPPCIDCEQHAADRYVVSGAEVDEVLDTHTGDRFDASPAELRLLNHAARTEADTAQVLVLMTGAAEGLLAFGEQFDALMANGGGVIGKMLGFGKGPKD